MAVLKVAERRYLMHCHQSSPILSPFPAHPSEPHNPQHFLDHPYIPQLSSALPRSSQYCSASSLLIPDMLSLFPAHPSEPHNPQHFLDHPNIPQLSSALPRSTQYCSANPPILSPSSIIPIFLSYPQHFFDHPYFAQPTPRSSHIIFP